MAKADYLRCDLCDRKIIYDGDDKIQEGLDALGLSNVPTYCDECAIEVNLTYAYRREGLKDWKSIPRDIEIND